MVLASAVWSARFSLHGLEELHQPGSHPTGRGQFPDADRPGCRRRQDGHDTDDVETNGLPTRRCGALVLDNTQQRKRAKNMHAVSKVFLHAEGTYCSVNGKKLGSWFVVAWASRPPARRRDACSSARPSAPSQRGESPRQGLVWTL